MKIWLQHVLIYLLPSNKGSLTGSSRSPTDDRQMDHSRAAGGTRCGGAQREAHVRESQGQAGRSRPEKDGCPKSIIIVKKMYVLRRIIPPGGQI
jgi:hypothetical protein